MSLLPKLCAGAGGGVASGALVAHTPCVVAYLMSTTIVMGSSAMLAFYASYAALAASIVMSGYLLTRRKLAPAIVGAATLAFSAGLVVDAVKNPVKPELIENVSRISTGSPGDVSLIADFIRNICGNRPS